MLVPVFHLSSPSLLLTQLCLLSPHVGTGELGAPLVLSPVPLLCPGVRRGRSRQLPPGELEDASPRRMHLPVSSFGRRRKPVLCPVEARLCSPRVCWGCSVKPNAWLWKETWGSHLDQHLVPSRVSIEFASSYCPKLADSLLTEARPSAFSCALRAPLWLLDSTCLDLGLALLC